MKIIRAEHLGMCFGVRDAIALAQRSAAAAPLTILGDLVHNETVLGDLRERGIQFKATMEEVDTTDVMVTAHGTSDRTRNQIRRAGFNLLEATCPLVRSAHETIMKLAAEGFHPVIIGQRDHVEVRGLTGDLAEYNVVLTEADVLALPVKERFGVMSQTTQPIDKVKRLKNVLVERFPNSTIQFVDTVCRPTKQRQLAAVALAQQCDVVIVIGGAQSNNTRELVTTCQSHCARVHHVTNADGIRCEWLTGAQTVGLTAGTSTPDITIDQVERYLAQLTQMPV